jgi:hypothetical protein
MNHDRRLLAFSALLLCACATQGVNPAAPVTSPAPLVNSGQDAVVERKLAAIDAFSAQARDRPAEIPSDVRGVQLLDAPEAVQAVLAVKARVLDEFHDPRFVAVHQKLSDAFMTMGEKDLEYETTSGGQRAVTRVSFHEVLGKIADVAKSVTNQADIRATFIVHTDPSGATFDLCPQYLTEGCIHVTTDATIAAIFRGLYTYRVTLAGYKTVTYPLDLVHFTQTRLDCRLKAKTASPCTPR